MVRVIVPGRINFLCCDVNKRFMPLLQKFNKQSVQLLPSICPIELKFIRNYSKSQCCAGAANEMNTTFKNIFRRTKNVDFRWKSRINKYFCCDVISKRNFSSVVFCGNTSGAGSDVKQRHYSSMNVWPRRSSGKIMRPSTPSIFDTMNQPLTVCVEGNIGSGKTTFLEYFKKYPEVCVFDEPISKWRDCQGYNLLDLMYKDPKKWSMCFQSYVQLTMLDLHTKPIEQPIKMMERSIYSAQYCFVKNLHSGGLLEEAQYSVLNEWFNFSTRHIPIKLDLIVYLRTDPEVAFARTNKRGRSEENCISLEYLQSVHDLHEDWLVNKQHLLPCPVLTLDANTALEDMARNYDECRKNMFQKVAVAN